MVGFLQVRVPTLQYKGRYLTIKVVKSEKNIFVVLDMIFALLFIDLI